jgi:hypothetical protein
VFFKGKESKTMIPKYEEDFYGWAMANASLMKEGKMSELDIENLIEEIESMGRSENRQLRNRLTLLLTHLLKWSFQTDRQCRSWQNTIREQRKQVKNLLKENPSLKSKIQEDFQDAYEEGAKEAVQEMGLFKSPFPQSCPYTLEQCLNDEFLPG